MAVRLFCVTDSVFLGFGAAHGLHRCCSGAGGERLSSKARRVAPQPRHCQAKCQRCKDVEGPRQLLVQVPFRLLPCSFMHARTRGVSFAFQTAHVCLPSLHRHLCVCVCACVCVCVLVYVHVCMRLFSGFHGDRKTKRMLHVGDQNSSTSSQFSLSSKPLVSNVVDLLVASSNTLTPPLQFTPIALPPPPLPHLSPQPLDHLPPLPPSIRG